MTPSVIFVTKLGFYQKSAASTTQHVRGKLFLSADLIQLPEHVELVTSA